MSRKPPDINEAIIALIIVVVFVVAILAIADTSGVLFTNIGNRGQITTINVLANVSSIDWGTLSPSEAKNATVMLTNSGNTPIKLMFSTSNWLPANASSYIDVAWDYANQTIAVANNLPATFTLTVSPLIEGIDTFSFNMTITGVKQ